MNSQAADQRRKPSLRPESRAQKIRAFLVFSLVVTGFVAIFLSDITNLAVAAAAGSSSLRGQAPAYAMQTTPVTKTLTIAITPSPRAVGWATDLDGRAYFDGSTIHSGGFKDHHYLGALQFDLAAVPPGATIRSATLEMTGLDNQYKAITGTWQVQLLESPIDDQWPQLDYKILAQAAVDANIGPSLPAAELQVGQANLLPFSSVQVAALQNHLPNEVVSFRVSGPDGSQQNLFTWDSGYRNGEILATPPVLKLVVEPIAQEDYVIVTATPTPENVVTQAALAATATRIAVTTGTFTPVPPFWITPVVLQPSATPANTATAGFNKAVLTAEAYLFGTVTPLPFNAWTATPVPTSPSTPAANRRDTASLVIVTSTPTPENIVTVAALAQRATTVAVSTGTYTPVPKNWATPIIVTPRPNLPPAANTATVTFQAQVATAEAYLFGPIASRPNLWTTTPTPVFFDGSVADNRKTDL